MENTKVNLVDFLYPYMDILFLALNAPVNSNRNAHWFSNNLSFWNLLFDSGLITERIYDKLEGDIRVFGSRDINYNNWVYGVTDLDKETVETYSSKVNISRYQVERILEILKKNEVKRLCIMHSKVTAAFLASSLIKSGYGLVGKFMETEIYNVPFHNAFIPNKPGYYSLLIGNKSSSDTIIPTSDLKVDRTLLDKSISKEINGSGGIKFCLPDIGNEITEKDIKAKQLRITISFKRYFPSTSCNVTIIYAGQEYLCNYRIREGRSNILSLGAALINKIGLKAYNSIIFQKQEDYCYLIEKAQ